MDNFPATWNTYTLGFLGTRFSQTEHIRIGMQEGMNKYLGLCALQILLLLIFLLGYTKGRIFPIPIADIEELKAKIQAAVCIVIQSAAKLFDHFQ